MKRKYNSKKRKPKISTKKRKTRKKPGGTSVKFGKHESINKMESLHADRSGGLHECTTMDCVPSALFNTGFPSSDHTMFKILQKSVDSGAGVDETEFTNILQKWNAYDQGQGCTNGNDCVVNGIEYKNWSPRRVMLVRPTDSGDYSKLWTQDRDQFENGTYKYAGFATKAEGYHGAHAILIGKSASGKPVIIDPQELRQDIIYAKGPKIRYVWEGNAEDDFGTNSSNTISQGGHSWGSGIEDYFKYIAYLYNYADPSWDPKTWLTDLHRVDGGGTIENLPGTAEKRTATASDLQFHEEIKRGISVDSHVPPPQVAAEEALKEKEAPLADRLAALSPEERKQVTLAGLAAVAANEGRRWAKKKADAEALKNHHQFLENLRKREADAGRYYDQYAKAEAARRRQGGGKKTKKRKYKKEKKTRKRRKRNS